ncbi:hypothetical protein LCGC14_0146960 [marine sediment metagenome]|uniref:Uncharacterized protein n=1 Tax=marine sediment metagenome TaxID=412755 RepID=A0A0F9V3K8_9ZZZZ
MTEHELIGFTKEAVRGRVLDTPGMRERAFQLGEARSGGPSNWRGRRATRKLTKGIEKDIGATQKSVASTYRSDIRKLKAQQRASKNLVQVANLGKQIRERSVQHQKNLSDVSKQFHTTKGTFTGRTKILDVTPEHRVKPGSAAAGGAGRVKQKLKSLGVKGLIAGGLGLGAYYGGKKLLGSSKQPNYGGGRAPTYY